MKYVFTYLALLNIFDGTVTFFGLHFGYIEESNPLMKVLYEADPIIFLGYKLLLSCLLSLFLLFDRLAMSFLIKYALYATTILYTIVCGYHSMWLALVLLKGY